jgi:hypothetical protein
MKRTSTSTGRRVAVRGRSMEAVTSPIAQRIESMDAEALAELESLRRRQGVGKRLARGRQECHGRRRRYRRRE